MYIIRMISTISNQNPCLLGFSKKTAIVYILVILCIANVIGSHATTGSHRITRSQTGHFYQKPKGKIL